MRKKSAACLANAADDSFRDSVFWVRLLAFCDTTSKFFSDGRFQSMYRRIFRSSFIIPPHNKHVKQFDIKVQTEILDCEFGSA